MGYVKGISILGYTKVSAFHESKRCVAQTCIHDLSCPVNINEYALEPSRRTGMPLVCDNLVKYIS